MQIIHAQIDPVLADQLQSVLDNSVSNSGNNGVSAHLIMSNYNVWDGNAGIGREDVAVTDTTLFHGASTTKFNIAILMMLLVEDGLVELDAPWKQYVSLNVAFDTLITVRQLLNHTSGIADYLETPSGQSSITEDFDFFFTPQEILENIVSDVPDFTAGTDFQYSNSNYVLAALIIEKVTGNPVHAELRNRLWEPLGMNHTYFGAYESYTEPTAGVWWNFGNGLTNYSDVSMTAMLSFAYGAGNIVTCPTDLAILLNGVFNGEVLLDQSLNEMLTFIPESFSSWTSGYGLGIHHAAGASGDVVLGHDGYYSNLTDMFYSTECGFTLVTMTNTQTAWFGIFNPMYDLVKAYCETTNVHEVENKIELKIEPNPSSGMFNIVCEKLINEVNIIDALGHLYFQFWPNEKFISINVEVPGIYFVQLNIANQTITKKLIVR